jgi:hypothetical protein
MQETTRTIKSYNIMKARENTNRFVFENSQPSRTEVAKAWKFTSNFRIVHLQV